MSLDIPLAIPFPDMPISIRKHGIESRIETTASIDVTNEASTGIEELDIQIEYTSSGEELLGILHFGATAWRPQRDYPPPPNRGYFMNVLKSSLAPGNSITLLARSLRVLTSCPNKARLTAIRVRFSDRTEFLRTVSAWILQEIGDEIPQVDLPIGSVPKRNPVYLLQLSISATGEVQEVQQLRSNPARLPVAVLDALRKWRLPPRSRDGEPEASKIIVVLRIMRESYGCDVYTCPIPFARTDLSPAFVVIDLAHTSITAPARPGLEAFDVYWGGANLTGDIW
jgi:hypothetical protein